MGKHPGEDNQSYVISYLTLRKAVGVLGLALPALLLSLFKLMNKAEELPPSISHYYYTNLGTVFTGTLCAVSLFFFAYKGPEKQDRIAAIVCCIAALIVAFCPTNSHLLNAVDECPRLNLASNKVRNMIHYGAAGVLFATLSYFCLFLFTKTGEAVPSSNKIIRNRIFRACGWIIIASVVCIIILSLPVVATLPLVKSINEWTFIFETIALVAFGISWLIKGEIVLGDENENQENIRS